MRLVFIRHAEPDYDTDTLTEVGKKEANALSKFYSPDDFYEVYSSTLGRAKETCNAVIKGQKEVHYCDWLKEFVHYVNINGETVLNWDFYPDYMCPNKDLHINDNYLDTDVMKSGEVKKYYDEVIEKFDEILKKNGYTRYNDYYRVDESNERTLVFFCHLGIMAVLMSHLMNIPYIVITDYMCCPTTGVTTFVSEERKKGISHFRALAFGDTSHLAVQGLKPSFCARFCEFFESPLRH